MAGGGATLGGGGARCCGAPPPLAALTAEWLCMRDGQHAHIVRPAEQIKTAVLQTCISKVFRFWPVRRKFYNILDVGNIFDNTDLSMREEGRLARDDVMRGTPGMSTAGGQNVT